MLVSRKEGRTQAGLGNTEGKGMEGKSAASTGRHKTKAARSGQGGAEGRPNIIHPPPKKPCTPNPHKTKTHNK